MDAHAVIVVVMRAVPLTMKGPSFLTAATTSSTAMSFPRSTTVNPDDLIITAAMFLPMSCGSPSTACMMTFPLVFLPPGICFSAIEMPISIVLAAIMISGR